MPWNGETLGEHESTYRRLELCNVQRCLRLWRTDPTSNLLRCRGCRLCHWYCIGDLLNRRSMSQANMAFGGWLRFQCIKCLLRGTCFSLLHCYYRFRPPLKLLPARTDDGLPSLKLDYRPTFRRVSEVLPPRHMQFDSKLEYLWARRIWKLLHHSPSFSVSFVVVVGNSHHPGFFLLTYIHLSITPQRSIDICYHELRQPVYAEVQVCWFLLRWNLLRLLQLAYGNPIESKITTWMMAQRKQDGVPLMFLRSVSKS